MAKNLILYDKYNKIINTTLDVIGTTGTITIENLTPETDYLEGEFYVGWEVRGRNKILNISHSNEWLFYFT